MPLFTGLPRTWSTPAVEFGAWPDGTVAGVFLRDDGKLYAKFNEIYQYEHFGRLASTMFHEALHSDGNVAKEEEQVAAALHCLVDMQLLATDPSLASHGTSLSKLKNTLTMARLNSGSGTRMRLFGDYGNIFPRGSKTFPNFASQFGGPSASTTGNALLRTTLSSLAETGNAPPANADFDQDTLNFIDLNHKGFTPTLMLKRPKPSS